MIAPKLRNWIVGSVTVVWIINFIATLIPNSDYKPDPAIHAVFMAIVGGAIGLSRPSKHNGNGSSSQRERELTRHSKDEEG